jgi:hypothetical protein
MMAMVVVMVAMAMPVAAVMHHAMVVVMPAVLARRNDPGHGAEHADDGGSSRRVVVAVDVAAAGAGGQRSGSQCNRGRSSNSDCAAGHNTHFDFPLMLSPHWGSTSIQSKCFAVFAARQIMFLQCRSTDVQPQINRRSAIAFATIRVVRWQTLSSARLRASGDPAQTGLDSRFRGDERK